MKTKMTEKLVKRTIKPGSAKKLWRTLRITSLSLSSVGMGVK